MPEQILIPDAPERIKCWSAIPDVEDRGSVIEALTGRARKTEDYIADGWPSWLPDALVQAYPASPYAPLSEYSAIEDALGEIAHALAVPVDYEAARWRLMIATLINMHGYEPGGVAQPIVTLHERALYGDPPAAEQWGAARDALWLASATFSEQGLAAVAARTAEAAVLAAAWPGRRDMATARVLRSEVSVSELGEAGPESARRELGLSVQGEQRRRLRNALLGVVRGPTRVPHDRPAGSPTRTAAKAVQE